MFELLKKRLLEYGNFNHITRETKILELEMDSFSYISLINTIEADTGIAIPDEELLKFQTIGNVVDYLQNPWNQVLKFETVQSLLKKQAQIVPNKIALQELCDDQLVELSYEQLWESIQALGTAFYARGIQNKRVMLCAKNSWQYVLTILTLFCSNNVAIPVNDQYRTNELDGLITQSGSQVIFYDEDTFATVMPAGKGCKKITILDLEALLDEGRRLLKEGNCEFVMQSVSPDEAALILYTSGTTGSQLGVIHNHGTIAWNARHFDMTYALDGVNLNTLPLYHCFGLLVGVVAVLAVEGCVAVCRDVARNLERYCKAYQPHQIILVPMTLEYICKKLSKMTKEEANCFLGKNCHAFPCGGAFVDNSYYEILAEKELELIVGYGMTEVGTVVSVTRRGEHKIGSVGKIVAGTKVKIQGKQDSKEEKRLGEILVGADWVMQGYEKEPERTQEVLYDGWLHTGDIGYVDEYDWLYIIGRKKNMIVLTTGENVSPEELEETINVSEAVVECMVIERNNQIAAQIYPNQHYFDENLSVPKEEFFKTQLAQWNSTLPLYKRIHHVDLLETPLPRTATGKLKRTTC